MKAACFVVLVCLASSVALSQAQLKEEIGFKLGENEVIRALAFAANSRRIVAGGDMGTLAVYELSNGDKWYLPAHPSKIVALAFSYDSRYVACASEDGTFTLYDFQDSKPLKLNGASGLVKSIAFHPSGAQMATSGDDGVINIWDMMSREKVATFAGRKDKVLSLSFSPDGKLLATGSADKTINLWNPEKKILTKTFTGHKDWVRAIAFSADGQFLASGSYDKTIRVWDLATATTKYTFQANKDWVTDLHYSPDGKYILSGGARGEVIILGSGDGRIIQKLNNFGPVVSSALFSNDGKWMVVADLRSKFSLYDCAALKIQPWKPFDITPPALAVLSPKLLSTKDVTTGLRKSVVHQPTVRFMLEVTDISGIKEVFVNGIKLTADASLPDRYSTEFTIPINSDKTVLVKATDNAGNNLEERIQIEHKRFSGSIDGDKYHAILIAIQDYKDPNIQDLDQPLKDMNRLKNVLLSQYDFRQENVIVLENPDRNTLYAKFDELQSKLDKLDNLLIFYAGHGFWDEQLEQGYWLPSDAETNKRSSWLSNGSLRDYIGGISSRHTLLITDACFSGGIFKSRAVFENASTAIETLYLRKSRKAMTSGTLEKVPDKSVFIDALIERLQQNEEPYITAEELFSGIRREVIDKSPSNQVPQYGEVGQTGDSGGEFIFIRKN